MYKAAIFLCVATAVITLLWKNVEISRYTFHFPDSKESNADGSPEERIKALEMKIQTLMEVCGSGKKESGRGKGG